MRPLWKACSVTGLPVGRACLHLNCRLHRFSFLHHLMRPLVDGAAPPYCGTGSHLMLWCHMGGHPTPFTVFAAACESKRLWQLRPVIITFSSARKAFSLIFRLLPEPFAPRCLNGALLSFHAAPAGLSGAGDHTSISAPAFPMPSREGTANRVGAPYQQWRASCLQRPLKLLHQSR